jgi:hypothetical protein
MRDQVNPSTFKSNLPTTLEEEIDDDHELNSTHPPLSEIRIPTPSPGSHFRTPQRSGTNPSPRRDEPSPSPPPRRFRLIRQQTSPESVSPRRLFIESTSDDEPELVSPWRLSIQSPSNDNPDRGDEPERDESRCEDSPNEQFEDAPEEPNTPEVEVSRPVSY